MLIKVLDKLVGFYYWLRKHIVILTIFAAFGAASFMVYSSDNEDFEITWFSVDYQVLLLENGAAQITETREMDVQDASELFLSFYFLDSDSYLEDVEVSVNGETLVFNENWDSDDSREEKAGYYGLLNNDEEIVWGIPEYGEQQIELTYTIRNFVRQLEDGQGTTFTFIDTNSFEPEILSMTISGDADVPLSNNLVRIFGRTSDVNFSDDPLTIDSIVERTIMNRNRTEEFTLLVQFLDEPFLPEAALDITREQHIEFSEAEQPLIGNPIRRRFLAFRNDAVADPSYFLPLITVALVLLGLFVRNSYNRLSNEKQRFPSRKRLVKNNENSVIYPPPYDDNPWETAYILYLIFDSDMKHFFYAYLVKWMHEGLLDIQEGGSMRKNRQKIHLLEKLPSHASKTETECFKLLEVLANHDGVINPKKLERLVKNRSVKIESIQKELLQHSKEQLESKGYLTSKSEKSWIGFRKRTYTLTKKGEDLANGLIQFQQFFESGEEEKAVDLSSDEVEGFIIWGVLLKRANRIVRRLNHVFPHLDQDLSIVTDARPVMTHFNRGYSRSVRSGSGGFGGGTGGSGGGSVGGSSSGAR